MTGKGTRKHTIRTLDGNLTTTTEEGDFKWYLHGENSRSL